MIKKLLFASILTTFAVSTMAQTYDLFIGDTDSLNYEWSRGNPGGGGFVWNSNFGTDLTNSKDSVGAVTYGDPYEGTTHYEFYYDFPGDYWCSGAWVLDKWDEETETYPGNRDLSAYTHLKLYWKGFSGQNPDNILTFQFSDANGAGPSVVVCDSSNNLTTYTEKLIPLSSFVGFGGTTTLNDLTAVQKITFALAQGSVGWGGFGGASSGVFFLDAIQFVNLDATGVSKSAGSDSYAAYPTPFTDETVIKINSTVNAPMSIKVMDTKGTVVSTSEGHFTNENITLGKELEKGIYFVHVVYQNRAQVVKIVKM